MLRNYIKIAFRNLQRNSLYSFINIFGLSLGLTSSFLLFLFISHELSYDNFHSKADRIARVVDSDISEGSISSFGNTSYMMGNALLEEYAEVVNQTKLVQPFGHIDIHWKGERISERKWAIADSTFFEMFDFAFIEGNRDKALSLPNSIVITESTAFKYFGNESALNQSMPFEGFTYKVTGVIEDMPPNSQLDLTLILSVGPDFTELPFWKRIATSWDFSFATTYVELANSSSIDYLNTQLPSFIEKIRGEGESAEYAIHLQPLRDVYLKSDNIERGLVLAKGSWFTIYVFGAVALFLIIMACINYINLATAKSLQRAKEIGTRKVSGASHTQLIFQFLSEAMLITLLAFLISVFAIDLLGPHFNSLIGIDLSLESFSLKTISLLFSLSLLIGIISGSYPAFYLSKLQPSEALKSDFKGANTALLRKSLVIVQFALSIFMIVATVVVSRQMNFMNNKSLGFDKEQLLVIDINNRNVRSNFESMKTQFSNIPGVETSAVSSRVPGEWKNINEIDIKPQSNASDSLETYFMCFDEHMLDAYEFELTQGVNFRGMLAEDSTQIIINETAAERLGGNMLGKNILIDDHNEPFKVIGVVKDFNFQSLRQPIAPLVIGYWSNPVRSIDYFTLKLSRGADPSEVVEKAKLVHRKFDESTAMEYHFLDQQLALFYAEEQQVRKVFSIGAALMILIACMGLFGMASFTVQKRTKEIGVRKVLGASRSSLFLLLSKTFVVQVMVSFAIAAPISYYFMSKWLDNFAYSFDLGFFEFLSAALIAIGVAIFSVSYRVLKTTRINPSQTLRN